MSSLRILARRVIDFVIDRAFANSIISHEHTKYAQIASKRSRSGLVSTVGPVLPSTIGPYRRTITIPDSLSRQQLLGHPTPLPL